MKNINTKSNFFMTTKERIKGALYGFALGDALGLGTEFMTRREAAAYYPGGLRDFDSFIRDSHRMQWKRASWTNDTIMFTSMLESILRHGGYERRAFAQDFRDIIMSLECDSSPLLKMVVSSDNWVDNPIADAARTWKRIGQTEASNESVHRSMVVALAIPRDSFYDTLREMVLITNADSRCVSSALVLAVVARQLLRTGELPPYDRLTGLCYGTDGRTVPFLDTAHKGTVEDLELDDEDTMSYTRMAMSAGLWPMWHCDNAADCIYSIVDQGGDADSNAALSGCLAGLRYGYDALPELKNELAGRDYLDDLTERLTEHFEQNILE